MRAKNIVNTLKLQYQMAPQLKVVPLTVVGLIKLVQRI